MQLCRWRPLLEWPLAMVNCRSDARSYTNRKVCYLSSYEKHVSWVIAPINSTTALCNCEQNQPPSSLSMSSRGNKTLEKQEFFLAGGRWLVWIQLPSTSCKFCRLTKYPTTCNTNNHQMTNHEVLNGSWSPYSNWPNAASPETSPPPAPLAHCSKRSVNFSMRPSMCFSYGPLLMCKAKITISKAPVQIICFPHF